jgi:glycerol-3-phosphate acyltransferase PlsY
VLVFYFILAAVGGYLLGSIPFGLVITRAAGLGDIREIGSGNIGATNVLRTGRKDLALATLLLDAGKAGLALLLARVIAGDSPLQIEFGLVAGAAAFVGHCYPVWLGFRGGKGVATFFGVLFAGVWPLGLMAAITWLGVATIFRYSSLAALCAAAVTPLLGLVAGFSWSEVLFTLTLAMLIFWRHRSNITRLRARTEPQIGGAKAERAPAPPPVAALVRTPTLEPTAANVDPPATTES